MDTLTSHFLNLTIIKSKITIVKMFQILKILNVCRGHTQYRKKINVWAGIPGDAIVVPLFLNENLIHLLEKKRKVRGQSKVRR